MSLKGRDTIYHGSVDRRGDDDIDRTPDVSFIKNPDVAHEVSDVSVRPIAQFVVGLFIFAVVICVLMLLLFNLFERRAVGNELEPSPVARQGAERLPPEPRLQGAPGFQAEGQNLELREPQSEMKVVREKWEQELKGYGWADQQNGRVRIPIKDAIKLMAQREGAKAQSGVPAATQTKQGAPESEGESIPSSSSSGQRMERRNQ